MQQQDRVTLSPINAVDGNPVNLNFFTLKTFEHHGSLVSLLKRACCGTSAGGCLGYPYRQNRNQWARNAWCNGYPRK